MQTRIGRCPAARPRLLAATVTLLAGTVCSPAWADADQQVEDAIEQLNVLIDKIETEVERTGQRKQVQSLANYVTQLNYLQAQKIAAINGFHAPSPASRDHWKKLAALFEERAAAQRREAKAAVDEFFAGLPMVWSAAAAKDLEPHLETLKELPRSIADRELHDRLNQVRSALLQWHAVVTAEEQGRYREALDGIDRMIRHHIGPVRVPAEKLLERKGRLEETMAAAVDQFIAEAVLRLAAATTGRNAEKVWHWMQARKLHEMAAGNTPGFARANELLQFAQRWQNVLIAEEAGDFAQAESELRNLRSSQRLSGLLGQDRIQQKVESVRRRMEAEQEKQIAGELASLDEAIEEAGSGEDLEEALALLQGLARGNLRSANLRNEISALQNDIQNLDQLQKAVARHELDKVGYWLQRRSKSAKHRWTARIAQLERKLAIDAITSTGQLEMLQPRDTESIGALLLRTADQAADSQDWQRVFRLLETYKSLYGSQVSGQAWLQAELTASKAFVEAQSYERAGDVARAIGAFRVVLTQAAARVPRADAEARLRELKKLHPKFFEPKTSRGASEKPPSANRDRVGQSSPAEKPLDTGVEEVNNGDTDGG